MDKVNFIMVEEDQDLVLSLSFDEGTEFGVEGFIVQRSPQFEFILAPEERGPSLDWTDEDEIILVREVTLSKGEIKIKTKYREYAFDLSGLSRQDLQEMKAILKKMNFDNSFRLKAEIA